MLSHLKINEFVNQLASSEPVPGGGAVAALCSSLACALASMVGRLTVGKKGYEAEFEKAEKIVAEFDKRSEEFRELMEEDVIAFNKVMDAFGLPKATDDEKKARTAAIQASLKGATEVPMKVAEKSAELFDTLEYLVHNGNKNAQSDALVGTMMARNAVIGALFNVKINLDSIKDMEYVEQMTAKVKKLEDIAIQREKQIVFGG
ncbi:MAG: cyclodeaminase/cyclohydrolase family protein [Bacillota bacterium]|nr:cyclodeaminase/cyclohydrolase family protein [Bacillota bacterium]